MTKTKLNKEEYVKRSIEKMNESSLISTVFQMNQGLVEAVKKYDEKTQKEFLEWFYDLTKGYIMIDELYKEKNFLLSLMGMIYIEHEMNYILEFGIGVENIISSFENKDDKLNIFVQRIVQLLEESEKSENKTKSFERIFMLTPNRYKMNWLEANKNTLDNYDRSLYPTLFLEAYKSLEYGFEHTELEQLKDYEAEIKKSDYTKEKLDFDLKGYLTVYRGEGSKSQKLNDRPASWTTSQETAKFFALRFDDVGTIHTAKIHKDDVYATFDSESEVLIDGQTIELLASKTIKKQDII